MNKLRLITIIFTTVILMTACVDNEKNKLDNRILDFWNAKIKKDFKSAYPFLSPGWKKNENLESYVLRKNQSKVNWTGASIRSKICKTKSLCMVELNISYEYQFKGAMGKPMKVDSAVMENWIMKDNIWYHLPIKKKLGN